MRIVCPKIVVLCMFCFSFAAFAQEHDPHEHPAHHHPSAQHYTFIRNNGQWDPNVRYRADINSGRMWLCRNSIYMQFLDNSEMVAAHGRATTKFNAPEPLVRGHNYRIEFQGSKDQSICTGSDATKNYFNFFQSADAQRWRGGVPGFKKVAYRDIYEDIDLVFYTRDAFLKYDFFVKSHTDPSCIRMKYTGADEIYLKNGHLIVKTSVNVIQEEKPYAFQIIDEKEVKVPCRFKLDGQTVSFEFPKGYDETYDLIIDPVLIFSTYSGSTANNFGMTATYDNAGNLFSAGIVFDQGFDTTTGAFDPTFNNLYDGKTVDIILTKYTADGTAQIYSTYLGGAEGETPNSLIVNHQNQLCMFGVTGSDDFPVTAGAYDETFAGGPAINWPANGIKMDHGSDIYVARFSEDGTQLLACTYVGGADNDGVTYNAALGQNFDFLVYNYGDQIRGEIMIDNHDNMYIASSTRSADFPFANGFDSTLAGSQDGVIFKLNSNLNAMLFSSYIGGDGMDAAYNIKCDNQHHVFVCGGTTSANFPTAGNAYSTSFNGGLADGFVMKINPEGDTILASGFIGTPAYDQTYFMDIDRLGKVFLFGQTEGSMPVSAGVYSNPNSGQFIWKMSNDLTTLERATVFGNGNGMVNISPSAFLVDVCGNIYATGWGGALSTTGGTPLTGMPLTHDAFMDETPPYDGHNFYLIVLERDFRNLLYGSYFGGAESEEHVDGGTSRFDPNGIVYQSVCAGCLGNSDFPTTPGAWSSSNQSMINGEPDGCNNGMFKYDFEVIPVAEFAPNFTEGCKALTVSFENTSSSGYDYLWDFGNNDTTSMVFHPVRTFSDTGTYEVLLIVTDSLCNLTDTARHFITVHDSVFLALSNDTSLCINDSLWLTASTKGTAAEFIWSGSPDFNDTLNASLSDSTVMLRPNHTGYYYVQASNSWCSSTDSVLITIKGNAFFTTADTSICLGDSLQITAAPLNPPVNASYSWSPPEGILSGQNSPVMVAQPTATTLYYVTIHDHLGCQYLDSVWVQVFDLEMLNLHAWAEEDTLIEGQTTHLHGVPDSSGLFYNWSPAHEVSNPNAATTAVSPSATTTYTLTISGGTCSRSGEVTVWVFDDACGPPDIFVPNAFTPNNDGHNDLLFVRGNNIRSMYFAIYNRWGEKVFETVDRDVGWDGTYKGMKASPAVFVYYLEVTCIGNHTFFKKGNITLIR